MPSLSVLAESDPTVKALVDNLGVSNREAARQLGINESIVRRYRAKRLRSPYSVSTPQPKHVNGVAQWVPGLDLGQEDGEVRTIPRIVGDGIDEPLDADLMRELGVDPEQWEIIARRESRWQQTEGGDFLRAYRISVRRRGSRTGDLSVESMNEILRQDYSQVGGYNPDKGSFSDDIFVVPVADLQVGKSREKNGGTPELIDRFAVMTEKARQRLEDAGGTRRLVLPWLGDCVEGVISQGGRLATRLDLSITEQVRIYRRLMLHQIAAFAPLAENVVVIPIAGNHDEPTRMFATSPTDSWSLEGASAVEDALRLSGKYEHVAFLYPEDDEKLVTSVDVGSPDRPYVIAATHGHLAKQGQAVNWWRGQSFGRQGAAGNADMLLSGHYHNLTVQSVGGGRVFIQAPALDGGSAWWARKTGEDESAGMLSFWVTPGRGNGWEGLTCHT